MNKYLDYSNNFLIMAYLSDGGWVRLVCPLCPLSELCCLHLQECTEYKNDHSSGKQFYLTFECEDGHCVHLWNEDHSGSNHLFARPRQPTESTAPQSYEDKLRHPKWQKKRLEIMSLRGWACEECGATEQELHVHHLVYSHGRNPWEYDTHELACLCATCHGLKHPEKRTYRSKVVLPGWWKRDRR